MDDDDPVNIPMGIPGFGGGASFPIVGIVAGLLPFFLSFRSTQTVNGEVVSSIDYVAIPGGAIALLLGGIGLFGALRGGAEGRTKKLALGGVAAVLGVVQLLRGFGILLF